MPALAQRRKQLAGQLDSKYYRAVIDIIFDNQKGLCNICKVEIKHQGRYYAPTYEKHLITNWMTVDHILPVSKGGDNDDMNLQLLCRSCNSRKGAKI